MMFQYMQSYFQNSTTDKPWQGDRTELSSGQQVPPKFDRVLSNIQIPSVILKSFLKKKKKTKLHGLGQRANYTDRRLLAKLGTTFADRGCRMVSATDSHCR
jgi:hypothetical protein